jgi:hypothetical protein
MKKLIPVIVILILGLNSFSQNSRIWATYYGGSDIEYGQNTVTDTSNNVYLSGNAYSTSGIASGGFQNTFGGGLEDAYLVKFNAAGNRVWATYYGGTDNDEGNRLATDYMNNVYITGTTLSSSSIASGGYQNTIGGGQDGFLVKFNASGNRIWATYLGGSSNDNSYDVTTDNSDNVYIAGRTNSSAGIASGGFQNSYGGGTSDAFVAKFNSTGNLQWSTYYGGSGDDEGFGVIVDSFGNVYLSGTTNSSSGIASGGFQNTLGGSYDNFIVKFDASGNRMWATYYGGTGLDNGGFVNLDLSGNIFLSGNTASTSGISSGGFQNTYGGGSNDAFLAKFSPSGGRLWATYYGGSGNESCGYLTVGKSNNVYLAGSTASGSSISSGGFQNTKVGSSNLFLVSFDAAGNRLCATYYGQGGEFCGHPSIDRSENIFLPGATSNSSGIASGGYSNSYNGGSDDAFLVKFSSCAIILNINIAVVNQSCTGLCNGSATLNVQGSNPPYTYLWNTTPSQTTQTGDSLCAGNYSVTVTDNIGNTASTNIVITNHQVPSVNLGHDTTICTGNSLFLNAGNTGCTYSWSTGSTNQNIIATSSGLYMVTVSNGYCTDADSIMVIFEPLNVNLGADAILCGVPAYNLNAGNQGSIYLWSTGAASQVIQASTSGTYWVQVTNSGGCVDRDSINLLFGTAVNAVVSNDTTVCDGNPLALHASGGTIYQWSNLQTGSTITVNPLTTTTYTVTISDAGCTDTASVTVHVGSGNTDAGPNHMICQGENVVLNATGGGTYLWSTGETTSSISVSPSVSTYYYVTETNGGCVGEDSVSVTVNAFQPPDLGPDTTICADQSITLNAGNSYVTYNWSTGSNSQSIAIDTTGIGLGSHSFSIEVTNSHECKGADSVRVTFELCTDIDEIPNDQSILIYPNPSSGIISLYYLSNQSHIITLEVINELGQQIISQTYNNADISSEQFDLSSAGNGLYLIKIYSDKNLLSSKRVIIFH